MKRKIYGLLTFMIFASSFLAVQPVFAGSPSNDTAKLSSACSKFGGSFSVTNGSSAGLSWTCYHPSFSGLTHSIDGYSEACKNLGGDFSVSNGSSQGYSWTCSGAVSGGTASTGSNGGSNGGGNGGGSSSAPVSPGGGSNGGSGGGSSSAPVSPGGGSSSSAPTYNPGTYTGATTNTKCGGVKTAIIGCSDSENGDALFAVLALLLNIVTYGVGAAAVVGVIITGFQYMSARDNPAQVVKAKNRLLQVVIGLVIWILFWGVLQFLLPGGLFGDGS